MKDSGFKLTLEHIDSKKRLLALFLLNMNTLFEGGCTLMVVVRGKTNGLLENTWNYLSGSIELESNQ